MGPNRRYPQLWGALVLGALGCTGTSTGNPIEDPGRGEETGGGNGQCEERRVVSLALDAESELGFSANDLLEGVRGSHADTLRWHSLADVSYGPEQGEQPLTLSLTPRGEARFIDYEPKAQTGGIEIGVRCEDALEVPLDVALRSAGGALDESFGATLSARSKAVGRIYHRLKADALRGSLTVTAPDGYALTALTFDIHASRFGLSGAIVPTLEKTTRDAASSRATGVLASWGPATCAAGGVPVPRNAEVASFSGDDVIALAAAHPEAPLRWSDGRDTTLTLAFTPSAGGACAVLEESDYASPLADGEVGTLRLAGTLRAQSADGRIDASWSGTLTARASASGMLDEATFEGGPGGVTGFDVSAYDRTYVRAALALAPSGSWSGDVTLIGLMDAHCDTTPRTDPGGGVSVPACPGAEMEEVARATLGGR